MEWKLSDAISYYKSQGAPADQSSLISLLREIQAENGGRIPEYQLIAVANAYGIKEGFLLALIRRIPSLHLDEGHCLELCAGPNCSKHVALAACAEKLQTGRNFTVKYVPCMRLCGKGPNIRWDGTLYHSATEELLRQLTEKDIFRKTESVSLPSE